MFAQKVQTLLALSGVTTGLATAATAIADPNLAHEIATIFGSVATICAAFAAMRSRRQYNEVVSTENRRGNRARRRKISERKLPETNATTPTPTP